jgi:hypothetical protein
MLSTLSGLNRPIAVLSVDWDKCAYLIVVAMVVWPRSICTAERGAPLIAK